MGIHLNKIVPSGTDGDPDKYKSGIGSQPAAAEDKKAKKIKPPNRDKQKPKKPKGGVNKNNIGLPSNFKVSIKRQRLFNFLYSILRMAGQAIIYQKQWM